MKLFIKSSIELNILLFHASTLTNLGLSFELLVKTATIVFKSFLVRKHFPFTKSLHVLDCCKYFNKYRINDSNLI
jgi:hypothetical protein